MASVLFITAFLSQDHKLQHTLCHPAGADGGETRDWGLHLVLPLWIQAQGASVGCLPVTSLSTFQTLTLAPFSFCCLPSIISRLFSVLFHCLQYRRAG